MTEHDWLEFVFQNLPPLEVEDNKIKQTKEGKERVKKMRQLASGMLFEENEDYMNSNGAHFSDLALQKKALNQLESLEGVILSADKIKGLEKY